MGKPGQGWFCDDFDYRCQHDSNPELMKNISFVSDLPPLTRQLVESADCFVLIGDMVDPNLKAEHWDPQTDSYDLPKEELREACLLRNVPIREIRRRNGENQEHLLQEDKDPEDEIDPEDALAHVDESLRDMSTPPPRWDLIYDNNSGYSSDIYPQRQDKRLRGYARNLEQAITTGNIRNSRVLWRAMQEARGRGVMTWGNVRRLWELYALNKHIALKGIKKG